MTLIHTTSTIALLKPESTTSNAPSAKPDGDSIENKDNFHSIMFVIYIGAICHTQQI